MQKDKVNFHIVKLLILFVLCGFANIGIEAQNQFDSGEGCLNVINVSTGPGLGEYGDRNFSVCYTHEKLLTDQFSVGVGIGYGHRDKYDISCIPVFASSTYFFLDKRFSPFVNMHLGLFGIVSKKNCDTKEIFSVPGKSQNVNLYMAPTVGVKAHINQSIGLMASLGEESYIIKAYDTKEKEYKSKFISNLTFSIGVFFQIPGW